MKSWMVMNYIYKKSSLTADEAFDETDLQMLVRIGKKFAVFFIILLFLNPIIDLLASVFDLIGEMVHLFLEIFETILEDALDLLFNFNHVQSEVILFNGGLLFAGFLLITLCRKIPKILLRFKRAMLAYWLRYKRRKASYWRHLSWHRKIKLVTLYSLGISLLTFLLPF